VASVDTVEEPLGRKEGQATIADVKKERKKVRAIASELASERTEARESVSALKIDITTKGGV